ncbi:hypothetical protein [Tolypothrix sp. VBCCA 56010]|uniref:hypothetical protein n=1 Tax=Tolypothrix sp. VBCCA 56010 TaxID=3137731 RepID=UPI003D7E862A
MSSLINRLSPVVADITQLAQAYGATGYQGGYASGAITYRTHAYGRLAFPTSLTLNSSNR